MIVIYAMGVAGGVTHATVQEIVPDVKEMENAIGARVLAPINVHGVKMAVECVAFATEQG